MTSKLIQGLERKIRKFVEEQLHKGTGRRDIERGIRKVVRTYRLKNKLLDSYDQAVKNAVKKAHKEAVDKYTWVENHTAHPERTPLARKIIESGAGNFSRANRTLEKNIVATILDGVEAGKSQRQITDDIRDTFRRTKSDAQVITTTSITAVERTTQLIMSAEAGITHKRYVGAGATRAFCGRWLGKVLRLDQIQKLDNGQGLQSLVYGGGWGCIHIWDDHIPKGAGRSISEKDIQFATKVVQKL